MKMIARTKQLTTPPQRERRRQAAHRGQPWLRLLLTFTIVAVVAACSAFNPAPVRPVSTNKTIKSASAPDVTDEPIIESSQEATPGVKELEIYEGSGKFINEEAATGRPKPVTEDGEIVLNFEGESIQSVVQAGDSTVVTCASA